MTANNLPSVPQGVFFRYPTTARFRIVSDLQECNLQETSYSMMQMVQDVQIQFRTVTMLQDCHVLSSFLSMIRHVGTRSYHKQQMSLTLFGRSFDIVDHF